MTDRKLVDELLKEIGQEYPECGFSVGPGWFPHVAKALRDIAALGIPWKLTQVKQKFCQLRIYVEYEGEMSPSTTPVDEIIDRASVECDKACEGCGAAVEPGMRAGSKVCTACKAKGFR